MLAFNAMSFYCGLVSDAPTRSYDSTHRRAMADQNQRSVFAAASKLFATRGWAATGMRDVAREAGVSVETVYGAAGSKRALLLRVIDIAIVGDDEQVPLAARPEFRALSDGERADRIAAAVELIAAGNERVALLFRAFAHGAADDAELAAAWHEARLNQRSTYAEGLRLFTGRRPRAEVVDSLWVLGSYEVFLQLTSEAGWKPQKYRGWLADHLGRLVATHPEEKP